MGNLALIVQPDVQKSISRFLLAVYLPSVVLIGLLHTDEFCEDGTGQSFVRTTQSRAVHTGHNDGFCLACLFAAGHLAQATPQSPHLSFTNEIPSWIPTFCVQQQPVRSSPRAPPFGLI